MITKIKEKLDKFFIEYMRMDGAEHLIISLVIFDILKYLMPIWMAVVITVCVMIYKEVVFDKHEGKGTPEKRDIFWGIVGILLGML